MNGFGFDSAAQFFGESAFDDGFSNTDSNGFGGSFFTESGDFSGNGFGDSSFIGESVGYTGSMSQFGSVFSESAFGEDGFSTDGMFCEGVNSDDSDKKGDYIDKHKGENAIGNNGDFKRAMRSRRDAYYDAKDRERIALADARLGHPQDVEKANEDVRAADARRYEGEHLRTIQHTRERTANKIQKRHGNNKV